MTDTVTKTEISKKTETICTACKGTKFKNIGAPFTKGKTKYQYCQCRKCKTVNTVEVK